MKRTSEDAFDATLDCICRLECSPLELLEVLKFHFERRLLNYNINTRREGFPVLIGKDVILRNIETLNNSMIFVKDLLSDPSPRKELSYDRFEENC